MTNKSEPVTNEADGLRSGDKPCGLPPALPTLLATPPSVRGDVPLEGTELPADADDGDEVPAAAVNDATASDNGDRGESLSMISR